VNSGRHEQRFPAVFVSHGAPSLAIEPGATHDFLKGFGAELGRPAAIVVFSAHFEAPVATLTSGERPVTIHDFGGFPEALYRIRYPAPGAPELAAEIVGLLGDDGISARADGRRGFDHGAWVPLLLMYPDADIPLLQVSINPANGTRYHHRLGARLAPLRDQGILIVGSGGATHNLRHYFHGGPGDPTPTWVTDFNEWLAETAGRGDVEALLDYRHRAPHARDNHPTEEHFLPFLCALGAAGENAHARRVHQAYEHGVLSLDAYAFSAGG